MPEHRKQPTSAKVFNALAEEYDKWFDSEHGKRIFELEVACIQKLIGTKPQGKWLEVGVGTGRFAQALGINEGVDPSVSVLEFAQKRGIKVKQGTAEALPYSNAQFDGTLMVVTICFLDNPTQALKECARILKTGGKLVIGFVPANSAWGKMYQQKAKQGHRFYSYAHFFTSEQIKALANGAGFKFVDAASTLFDKPESAITNKEVKRGIHDQAGFVAMLFERH